MPSSRVAFYWLAILGLCSLPFTANLLASGPARSAANGLVGAWRLVTLEEPDAGGKLHRADSTGLLVFSADGHLSVQVMLRNPHPGGRVGPVQYSAGGYEASFGTYTVDENSHTFRFHVEGAMVRTLVGKDLKRLYETSGGQMVVKSADPNEHWRATWERY